MKVDMHITKTGKHRSSSAVYHRDMRSLTKQTSKFSTVLIDMLDVQNA